MKIAYLILGTFNSGGMERVLSNKANYLADVAGYDTSIITSDQQDRPRFFRFSEKIRHYDLGINYSDTNGRNIFSKTLSYFKKQKTHRRRLSELLARERFDVVVSMFGPEVHWLPDIKDGSKKVAEIHFSKYFREQQARGGLWKMSDALRSRQDEKAIKKYHKFVVLTQEDKGYWGNKPNMEVVYNASTFDVGELSPLIDKRVISVGRLTHQKGYSRLIHAWASVAESHPDWKLDIFGSGEEGEALIKQIKRSGLEGVVSIHPPTSTISREYLASSINVLSSRYEGFGMVLVESMAFGVPCVSFTCKCGPRDIIDDGVDGILVPEGDVEGLADGICRLIEEEDLRREMGKNAIRKVREKFSEDKIMKQWTDLFESL